MRQPHSPYSGFCVIKSCLFQNIPHNHPICDTAQAAVCSHIMHSVVASSDAPNGAFFSGDLPPEWQCVKSVVGGVFATWQNPKEIGTRAVACGFERRWGWGRHARSRLTFGRIRPWRFGSVGWLGDLRTKGLSGRLNDSRSIRRETDTLLQTR